MAFFCKDHLEIYTMTLDLINRIYQNTLFKIVGPPTNRTWSGGFVLNSETAFLKLLGIDISCGTSFYL